MFVYGMRLKGFAPGCQPMAGLVKQCDDPQGKYYTLLYYTYPISADDMRQYELDFLWEEKPHV